MPDWLLFGISASIGFGIARRWPRWRLDYSSLRSPSRIAGEAKAMPGDDECVQLGHEGLAWSEGISWIPWWKPWGVRRTEITRAACGDCRRPQKLVRFVYPPDYSIRLQDPEQ